MGDINVSVPFNETNIPGVFAAGDCANPMKAVPLANAQAGLCAAGVVASLGLEGPIDENEIQTVLQGLSDAL
jgi:thioredoxin reductase